MPAAVASQESAFSDDVEIPLRQQLGVSLFMPGRVGEHTGIKIVSTVPGNPAGLVMVLGADGSPLGVVDGPTLTAIRTGAGAGLATRILAPSGARVLAMLGAGAMAFDQVEAVRAVRPIESVLVWSRSAPRAEELAARVDGEVVNDADAAIARADVVSCATPAGEPLFAAGSVRPNTHINAIGAFRPGMVEVPAEIVRQAYVVVDDVEAAATEAGDLIAAGRTPDATVGDLLAGRASPRGGVTLFKSVGIASQDVAAALAALSEASRLGVGTEV
ncbi:MAG TPA: ornithine cyclodeaminase [Acidimicrobiia bacterium]|nr:ornithine cyclodeaminase [Acidimicrobiia bacterium]